MEKKKSVLIGLSGGVDSAVAALLLKKQGYNVIGAFMKNFSENKNKLTGECHWVEDKKDAEKIAVILEIPLITLSFENEYKRDVIDPMFGAYQKGLTPNPDANCNKYIKFPLLWKEAQKRSIDYIATGHYARIKKKGKNYELHRAKDKEKDQTYFLYTLSQKDLQHTLFPIGNYTKSEIRQIAKKNKLPVYNKRGSRGICFVGKMSMKDFLAQRIKKKIGTIVNIEGKKIGTHRGTNFYTIGERLGDQKGAHITSKDIRTKMYVARKNLKSNTLIAVPEGNKLLYRNKFTISKFNTINTHIPSNLKARVRHRGELINSRLIKEKSQYVCILKKPTILAPGQSAVLYANSMVIGGGQIAN